MVNRADMEKRPDEVSGMFDDVARGYDRTNDVLSLGNAPLWRIATVRAIDPQPGEPAGAEMRACDFRASMESLYCGHDPLPA